jgi:putative transposase
MVQFIDDHRDVYGVELICAAVPIAPSTYFLHKAQHADPTRRSARAQQDDRLRVEIQRVWDANRQVYGPRKAGGSCGARGIASRVARSAV